MRYKIILAVVGLLVAGVFGWWTMQNLDSGTKNVFLPDKDRGLSKEQREIYSQKIAYGEKYLSGLLPAQEDYQQEQVNTYVYLALQYYGLGQLQKSKDYYELALRLSPDDEQGLLGLATTLTEAGDLFGAGQALETITKKNPKSHEAWLRYIELQSDMGASGEDLGVLYSRALEATGNYIDVVTKAAQFYEQRGDFAAAARLWQQASSQFPDNLTYAQEAARLQEAAGK